MRKENGTLWGSWGDLWSIDNYIWPASGELLGRSWPNAGEWAGCVPRTKLFVLNIFSRWRTKVGSWEVQSPLANQVFKTRCHLYSSFGPFLACWTIPSKLLEQELELEIPWIPYSLYILDQDSSLERAWTQASEVEKDSWKSFPNVFGRQPRVKQASSKNT